jgi:hypothetical protein
MHLKAFNIGGWRASGLEKGFHGGWVDEQNSIYYEQHWLSDGVGILGP